MIVFGPIILRVFGQRKLNVFPCLKLLPIRLPCLGIPGLLHDAKNMGRQNSGKLRIARSLCHAGHSPSLPFKVILGDQLLGFCLLLSLIILITSL